MSFLRCTVCREHGWFGSSAFPDHVCRPIWRARGEWQDDDEWTDVHADDAEEAAKKFAEKYDQGGDYSIVSNRMCDDVVICVRKGDELHVDRFAIEAEAVPTYYATKLEAK